MNIGIRAVSLSALLLSTTGYAQEVALPMTLGTLEASPPSMCGGESCYEVIVTCPNVAAPARANIKVGRAAGNTSRGTILFMTGVTGTQLYDTMGRAGEIIASAQAEGFQTVQIQWLDAWMIGAPGEEEGFARLACRPATVARWAHDQLDGSAGAFCATGHSAGASQASFMLTHYGLEEQLDAIVPTGGPVFPRVDLACGDGGGTWAGFMDASFGFLPPGFDPQEPLTLLESGNGPCSRGDPSFMSRFRSASLASEDADYVYPNTMVSFVFEGDPEGGAVRDGTVYFDLLTSRASPYVRRESVPDTTHSTEEPRGLYVADEGIAQITDSLLSACRVWE
jgi:hypothetical protein